MNKPQQAPLCLFQMCWLVGTFGAGAAAPELVVFQPPHIEAEVGQLVKFSCTFNYTGPKDQNMAVRFFRVSSGWVHAENVSCQPVGSSDTHFTCNLSVTIKSHSVADEDVYYCQVLMPRAAGTIIEKGPGTKLSLHVHPSSIKIQQSSPLVSGLRATLDCKVLGFYPNNTSVSWFCSGTPVLPESIKNTPTVNDDGTFSLHSQYNFSPMVKDDNTECVCQASHPAWTQTKKTSITLNVSYGPVTVTVTSDSEIVANGSVRVRNGSVLNLMCAADGNPTPKTQWLGESIKGVHQAETLHIPAVKKEHEGFYWCVAENKYGEQNTSVRLLVSYSNTANTDGSKTLYVLAVIPVVLLVLLTVIILLLKKIQKKKNTLAGQGLQADGLESHHDELAQPEGVIYAEPKRRKKKPKQQSADPGVLDSAQMVYSDIVFARPPRISTVTSDEPMTIYSEVGNGRGHGQDRRGQKKELDSVYTLAQMP